MVCGVVPLRVIKNKLPMLSCIYSSCLKKKNLKNAVIKKMYPGLKAFISGNNFANVLILKFLFYCRNNACMLLNGFYWIAKKKIWEKNLLALISLNNIFYYYHNYYYYFDLTNKIIIRKSKI